MTANKPDVKRYDCTSEDSYHCHGCFTMKEQLRGGYVEWEDYEALQAECEKLRACLAETAGVAVTMLYESHKADTLKEFDVTELARMVDYTKHLADANVQVEKVYRKAWNMAQQNSREPSPNSGGEG